MNNEQELREAMGYDNFYNQLVLSLEVSLINNEHEYEDYPSADEMWQWCLENIWTNKREREVATKYCKMVMGGWQAMADEMKERMLQTQESEDKPFLTVVEGGKGAT